MSVRQSSISILASPTRAKAEEIRPCPCLTIANTIGLLAFLSLISGVCVFAFGVKDVFDASKNELRVSIRLDPVILKAENPKFDGGLKNCLPIWIAAGVSGCLAGLLQMGSSVWFLANICISKNLNYKARIWMLCQMVASFILLILMGGIFIAGFAPDYMILSFGVDFIVLYILTLISVPIIRKEGKQITNEEMHLHGIGGLGKKIVFIPLLPTC